MYFLQTQIFENITQFLAQDIVFTFDFATRIALFRFQCTLSYTCRDVPEPGRNSDLVLINYSAFTQSVTLGNHSLCCDIL